MSFLPPLLYKYCNEQGTDILRNCRLKVTPPNSFNDPFEFTPQMAPDYPRELVEKVVDRPGYMEECYQIMLRRNPAWTHADFVAAWRWVIRRGLIEQILDGYPRLATQHRRKLLHKASKVYGLVCLSELRDNLLMWSHYTNSHRGIVIGFDTANPFFTSPRRIRSVKYDKNRALLDMRLSLATRKEMITRRKSSQWGYEKEWRQLLRLERCEIDGNTANYYRPIEASAIREVIMGVRATVETTKNVANLLALPQFAHVKWFRAVLHKSEFSLVMRRVR